MQPDQFNQIVQARLQNCADVLTLKDKEYSSETDRLHNFKVAAILDGEDPVQSLWGMWKKHIVSIIDLKNKLILDPAYIPPKELLAEKLGDNINYTLLLEGLIEERRCPDWVPEEEKYLSCRGCGVSFGSEHLEDCPDSFFAQKVRLNGESEP